VPVAGTRTLFSIWDTRVQDFGEFAKESGYDAAKALHVDFGFGLASGGRGVRTELATATGLRRHNTTEATARVSKNRRTA
jgi:hypothetical protein